jgi:hypothetical protein
MGGPRRDPVGMRQIKDQDNQDIMEVPDASIAQANQLRALPPLMQVNRER